MAGPLEREVKLRFDSAEDARRAVLALGASPLHPRRLQSDAVLDRPDRALSARGEVLRVRIDGNRHRVTFKAPLPHATMKLREEIETAVGDGSVALAVFTRLGFEVVFRYEKYREEFAYDDVVLAVDETPVGTFVEIEGSDRGILSTAAALGRAPSDFVLESYRGLYVQACAARGIAATDMIFERSGSH